MHGVILFGHGGTAVEILRDKSLELGSEDDELPSRSVASVPLNEAVLDLLL